MKRAIQYYSKDFMAMVGVIVLSIGVLAYIILQQDARPQIPVLEGTAFKLRVELSDSRGVVPGQGQEITVAGVQIGRVGKVELEEGKALVDADLDPKYKGLVRADATALLRPKTGLKDMFIEIDPGSKAARPLDVEERIPVANTAPDVDPDEVLAALDTDTRAYLQLLINGGGKGLEARGNDLREVFRRLGPLHRDLDRVMKAVAERRSNLRRLVHNYGSLTTRLGKEDDDLRRIVTASEKTLGAFAAEDDNISAAVRELGPTMNTTATTLGKVERLGRVLGPSLDALRPAFRQLDDTNAEMLPLARQGTPILRDRVRPFVRRARPYVRELQPAAADLSAVSSDLEKSLLEFNRFFNMASFNQGGADDIDEDCEQRGVNCEDDRQKVESYLYWLAWTAQNGVSTFSTGDASGPFRRAGAFFSCSSLNDIAKGEAGQNPLTGLVFGLGVCPGGGSEGTGRAALPRRNSQGRAAPQRQAAPQGGNAPRQPAAQGGNAPRQPAATSSRPDSGDPRAQADGNIERGR